jgi:hypothetical protein
MYNNTQGLILWIVIFIVTVLIGGCSFYYTKGRKAIFLSAFIPWSLFLILNFYLEYHSQDKEIMKGSWIAFQITLGSFVAIMGVVSGWVISRFIDRRT